MDKTTRNEAIGSLAKVLKADAEAIASVAAEAIRLLDERNQNGAVAELMLADAAVNRSSNAYKLVMSLHRDA